MIEKPFNERYLRAAARSPAKARQYYWACATRAAARAKRMRRELSDARRYSQDDNEAWDWVHLNEQFAEGIMENLDLLVAWTFPASPSPKQEQPK